ncbi:MAG: hypothetical protein J5843_03850, partial [Clostridia bacterium]|nr:hypothetical protein [Clostridia bacterium]
LLVALGGVKKMKSTDGDGASPFAWEKAKYVVVGFALIAGYALLITEEMHRLHANIWKNFPWNDWMYEPESAENGKPE